MKDDALTDSLITYIKRRIVQQIDVDSIIDAFDEMKDRWAQFHMCRINRKESGEESNFMFYFIWCLVIKNIYLLVIVYWVFILNLCTPFVKIFLLFSKICWPPLSQNPTSIIECL